MSFQKLSLKNKTLILAPMEGVVDSHIRDIYSEYAKIDLCVTEFIRVTNHELTDKTFFEMCPELKNKAYTKNNTPVVLQLLGSDPFYMSLNAQKAVSLGAHSIDVNFGCPAKTVNRHDGGASLLKTPERIYTILSEIKKNLTSNISLSAKIRLGFSHKDDFLKIAKAVEDAGADFICVHARTRDEGYRPPAHWQYIRQIKQELKIPVIANGEIWTIEDFKNCKNETQCENFMIGRGFLRNPLLARQIKNEISQISNWRICFELFMIYHNKVQNSISERYALGRSKQWLKSLSMNFEEAKILFEKLKVLESLEDFNLILNAEKQKLEIP